MRSKVHGNSEFASVGSTEIRVRECGVHGNSELASGVRSKDEEGGVEWCGVHGNPS